MSVDRSGTTARHCAPMLKTESKHTTKTNVWLFLIDFAITYTLARPMAAQTVRIGDRQIC
jgi:hypothetical protein